MRKLLTLFLILLCVGCSQKTSKNIDLVCEGTEIDGTLKPKNTIKNYSLRGDDLILFGNELKSVCNWSETEITCYPYPNQEGSASISFNRYGLTVREEYHSSGTISNFSRFEGKCKFSDKQI
jgi:hypothetical protein